jgi:hypothetical protein
MTSTTLPDNDELCRFRKNEAAVGRLAELMSDPVMRQAIDIITKLSAPTYLPEATPGLHPDTCTAHHFHMLIGVKNAIAKLKKMATAIKPGEEPEDADRDEFQDYADSIQPITRK